MKKILALVCMLAILSGCTSSPEDTTTHDKPSVTITKTPTVTDHSQPQLNTSPVVDVREAYKVAGDYYSARFSATPLTVDSWPERTKPLSTPEQYQADKNYLSTMMAGDIADMKKYGFECRADARDTSQSTVRMWTNDRQQNTVLVSIYVRQYCFEPGTTPAEFDALIHDARFTPVTVELTLIDGHWLVSHFDPTHR